MRKLFLLIPILAFALMANAKSVTITPTSPYYSHSNLQLALNAARSEKIDTILLKEGTYVESNNYLVADTNLVIMADESATSTPIVQIVTYLQIKNNANVKIKGIKFDGSAQGSYDYFIRFYDNSHSSLRLDDCEFYDVKKIVIQGKSDSHTDSLIVNNCFFHNNKQQAIYFKASDTEGRQTCDSLAVTNSTFAHTDALTNWISVIDVNPYGSAMTDAIKVVIDHCTFYNNPTVDSGHADIRLYKLSAATVSNCIFAHPVPYERRATYNYGGTVSNCLTYNLTYDSGRYGHRQDGGLPVLTNNIKGNPVFKDPENNDFTLLNASSARRLGTMYGDPRWHQAVEAVAIPATLLPQDAILSDSASVIAATPDSIDFKYVSSRGYTDKEWAKWKVTVSKDGLYNFTAHTYRNDAQKFEIKLWDASESVVLKENTDESMSSGDQTISTGNVNLVAGNTYVIKVRNIYNWSTSKLVKVVASYEGGINVAVPDTLWPEDALRSERAFVNENGELRFTDDSHAGYIHDQWAKWNISVAAAAKYKFQANVNSDNGQNYRITLKNEDESATICTWYGTGNSSGARKIATELVDLTTGNYVLMIEDTVNHSHGRVANIVASYEGGNTVTIPGQILAKEAVIGKVDGGHTPKMSHLMGSGDLKYDNNGYNLEEFATWTLNVTQAGEMEISFSSPSGGHQFRFELYQSETLIGAVEESDANWVHNVTLTDRLTFSATGDYTLKLINKQAYSSAVLHSITFAPYVAPSAVTMNDADTDISAWSANVDGAACNVTLNRTILGGMYNAICLPFALSSSQVKAAFGNDVELYYLNDASITNGILDLQFNSTDDIYQGTPYLIKTSSDVVNPVFNGISILLNEASSTFHTGWPVSFKGTFVAVTIPADNENLLLYDSNRVGFPNSDKTLKGFRAYFHLTSPSLAPAIKHARIIAGEQVVTSFDLVQPENNGAMKTIENGQLIIISDGVQYNVMGAKLQ